MLQKRNGYAYLPVGRASVAIYLALSLKKGNRRKIIVPANLCYAGIYPAKYAGYEPVFCDVDAKSGNVSFQTFVRTYSTEIAAAIVPHMYGNPVKDMAAIKKFCQEREIILIEDCASAMGARAADYILGAEGDYTIYSTGYSKTLDLGGGGFLFAPENELKELEQIERELLPHQSNAHEEEALFSRIYRLLRNQGNGGKIESMIYEGLPECCKELFLFRIDDEKKKMYVKGLDMLPDVIEQRRKAKKYYDSLICFKSNIEPYIYEKGAVPWRYNLFMPVEIRKKCIEECLRLGIPVSDWYPRVTPMFGCKSEYPNAEWHEKHILNFPLLIQNEEIEKISEVINCICN